MDNAPPPTAALARPTSPASTTAASASVAKFLRIAIKQIVPLSVLVTIPPRLHPSPALLPAGSLIPRLAKPLMPARKSAFSTLRVAQTVENPAVPPVVNHTPTVSTVLNVVVLVIKLLAKSARVDANGIPLRPHAKLPAES